MEAMRSYDRYGLLLNERVVKTPLVISAMAGIVDAEYALARAAHIGAAFLGGYSIDTPTLDASRSLEASGRKEFLYDDPVEELGRQVSRMSPSNVVCGLNMRGSCAESFSLIASQLGDRVIYEIDAHCRQEPLVNARCGEFLLHHTDLLSEYIKALKKEDVSVSVKIRAGVSTDDRLLAKKIWKAGADIIHVDVMDFGYQKVKQIRNSCPLVVIANNSINNFEKMKDMLSHGADLISLARHSDERTLSGLDAAISRFTDEHGWYNAPKQLCRGGDIRSLTFCCMPVKNCPLIPMLEKIGLSREDYLAFKQEAVGGTPLDTGAQTCFGSLAWCCKDSSPCMFREMTLREAGLSNREYMRQKKQLADKIMQHLFDEHADNHSC
ncbi:MAG: methanogenesis marker 9 domain-containing protein [Methanolinea sp.]|jgi:TIM-barrel protein|nr:methanogenesis marker 9 domain-containing protein [Methanolinea sp.]